MRDLVLGQGALTVSPLQMASVIGVIANDGRPLTVRLTPGPSSQAAPPILASEIAGAIRAALPASGDLAGQTASAVGGEKQHAWFIGFAPSSLPRWVIVVLLEQESAATANQIAAQVSATLMAP